MQTHSLEERVDYAKARQTLGITEETFSVLLKQGALIKVGKHCVSAESLSTHYRLMEGLGYVPELLHTMENEGKGDYWQMSRYVRNHLPWFTSSGLVVLVPAKKGKNRKELLAYCIKKKEEFAEAVVGKAAPLKYARGMGMRTQTPRPTPASTSSITGGWEQVKPELALPEPKLPKASLEAVVLHRDDSEVVKHYSPTSTYSQGYFRPMDRIEHEVVPNQAGGRPAPSAKSQGRGTVTAIQPSRYLDGHQEMQVKFDSGVVKTFFVLVKAA